MASRNAMPRDTLVVASPYGERQRQRPPLGAIAALGTPCIDVQIHRGVTRDREARGRIEPGKRFPAGRQRAAHREHRPLTSAVAGRAQANEQRGHPTVR